LSDRRAPRATLAVSGDYIVETAVGRVEETDGLLHPTDGPCVDEELLKAAMYVLPAGVQTLTKRPRR